MMSIFRNIYENEEGDQDFFLRCPGASVLLHLKLEKMLQKFKKILQKLENLIQELKFQPAKETPISAGLHEDAFTALDTFDVLQHSGKRDKDFIQIAGVPETLGAKELQNNMDREVLINCGDPSRTNTRNSNARLLSGMNLNVMLLMAAFFAMISFNAGLHPPGRRNEFREGDLSLTRLFVFFNSLVFFESMAVIILLLQKYTFKPWPTLSAVPLLGSYVCSVMAILPNQSRDLLFLSSSISLFVAAWMSSLGLCTSVF